MILHLVFQDYQEMSAKLNYQHLYIYARGVLKK